MRRKFTTRLSRLALAILALPALLFILWVGKQISLAHKYQRSELMGKTKEEIIEILGHPTSIVEAENVWIYQYGMKPEAALFFTNNRVVELD